MTAPHEKLGRLQRLRDQQSYDWSRGDRLLIEDYLASAPYVRGDRELLLDFIYTEICLRREHGERPADSEYVARFPDLVAELAPLFVLDEALAGNFTEIRPVRTDSLLERFVCPNCRSSFNAIRPADFSGDMLCQACGSSTTNKPSLDTVIELTDGPQRLGRFELLDKVGKGGFGTVYRARDSQLNRIVAIKVPRTERFSGREEEDRFEREARTAASLDHPGIVRLYEVGRTREFPYLISEFVDGQTLSEALAERTFSNRETVEIIAQAAEALQHAHGRGVIHRDVKPSNFMLMFRPGEKPIVRVMDFGLALMGGGESTMTNDGQLLGTAMYMSPEQAAGKSHRADGRADVYSLGVVLYQLLVGEVPFRGTFERVLSQVLYDDPRRPRSYNESLPRDLETITLKSLEKDPAKRYATAGELAADLRRFLAGEVVLARPVGPTARAWRWCKRKPLVAGLTAAVAASLVLGIAFSTYFAFDATRQKNEAVAAQKRADDNARQAELNSQAATANAQRADSEKQGAVAIADFLIGLFRSSDPLGFNGTGFRVVGESSAELKVRDVVDRGTERLAGLLEDQPLVRARLLTTLGDVYWSLGLNDKALPLLESALAIREKYVLPPHPDLAAAWFYLGRTLHFLSRYEDAGKCYEHAYQMQIKPGPNSVDEELALANTEFYYGWYYSDRSVPKNAETMMRDCLKIRKARLPRGDQQTWLAEFGLFTVLWNHDEKAVLNEFNSSDMLDADFKVQSYAQYILALGLRKSGQYGLAEATYRALLSSWEKQMPPGHPMVAILRADFAGLLREKGDYRGGEQQIDEALSVFRTCVGAHPRLFDPLKVYIEGLCQRGAYHKAEKQFLLMRRIAATVPNPSSDNQAWVERGLAICARDRGDYSAALDAAERGVEFGRHAQPDAQIEAAALLADIYDDSGRYAEAELHFRAAWEAMGQPDQLRRLMLLRRLVFCLRNQGKFTEARTWSERIKSLTNELEQLAPQISSPAASANDLNGLSLFYATLGDHRRAAELIDRARIFDQNARKYPDDHPVMAYYHQRTVAELRQASELREAESRCQLAVNMFVKHVGADYGMTAMARLELARVQLANGDAVSAERSVRETMTVLSKLDEQPWRWRAAGERLLGQALLGQDKFDQAAECFERSLRFLAPLPPLHSDLFEARRGWIDAKAAAGHTEQALSLAEAACQELRDKLPERSWRLAEWEELLAERLLAASRPAMAREALSRVLATYRAAGDDDQRIIRVQKKIAEIH